MFPPHFFQFCGLCLVMMMVQLVCCVCTAVLLSAVNLLKLTSCYLFISLLLFVPASPTSSESSSYLITP